MRLIDADALKEKYHIEEFDMDMDAYGRAVYLEDIDDATTIDPFHHAHWEVYKKFPGYLRCSRCKDCYVERNWPRFGNKWAYCPQCGAKMDEETDDGQT